MHRKIFGFFLFFLFVSCAYAQEQLTITTYYPSPNGVYKRLHAENVVIGPTFGVGLENTVQTNGNLTIFSNGGDGAIYLGRVSGAGTGYGWRIATDTATGGLQFQYANPFVFANPGGSAWSPVAMTLGSFGVGIGSTAAGWAGTYDFFVTRAGVPGAANALVDGYMSCQGLIVGNPAANAYMWSDTVYTNYLNAVVLTSTSKLFSIKHPTKPKMRLNHGSIEGPELGVYYRGQGQLIKGKTTIKLPDYFEALTRKDTGTILLTAIGEEPFLLSSSKITAGEFTAYGTKPDGKFFWEVKAERADVDKLKTETPDNPENNRKASPPTVK